MRNTSLQSCKGLDWGDSVDKRLENLRMYFPAEVTGAYVALQALLKNNNVQPSEQWRLMAVVAFALALTNIAIYWKFYRLTSWLIHAVLFFGFLIWVVNIDLDRFKDVRELNWIPIEIGGPILLIFYSLITMFISIPEKTKNAPTP